MSMQGDLPNPTDIVLDCDMGRAMGCASFCCRLIVRLRPGERAPGMSHATDKSCVDKDPTTGLCVCFDQETSRCAAWDERPQTCREYDCNRDPLLPIVLRDGFTSLTRLVLAPTWTGERPRRIPKVAHNAKIPRCRQTLPPMPQQLPEERTSTPCSSLSNHERDK